MGQIGHYKAWTPAEDARLKELKAAGRTNAEIATTLDRSLPAIRKRLQLWGIANPVPVPEGLVKRRKVVAALHAEGKTVLQIQRELRVSKTVVYGDLKALRLPPHTAPPTKRPAVSNPWKTLGPRRG